MQKTTIQLPPNSTGTVVGAFVGTDASAYDGVVLVDTDGNPVADELRRIRRLLELLVSHLASEERLPE